MKKQKKQKKKNDPKIYVITLIQYYNVILLELIFLRYQMKMKGVDYINGEYLYD